MKISAIQAAPRRYSTSVLSNFKNSDTSNSISQLHELMPKGIRVEHFGINFLGTYKQENSDNEVQDETSVGYHKIDMSGLEDECDDDDVKYTLEWARTWDETKRKKEIDEECESEIKKLSVFKKIFTERPEELRRIYAEKYSEERISVNALLKNAANLQAENSALDKKKEANEKLAEQLKKDAEMVAKEQEKFEKMKTASEIAKVFKKNNRGNLDEQIAGYNDEKMLVRKRFTDQIAAEKAGLEANIPNSLLLYGAIGTGKTTFVRALAAETGCFLAEIGPDSKDFINDTAILLQNAKQRYISENKRTMILVNEADVILSDEKENRRNVATMKSWLDNCSMVPNDSTQNASAATFVFTTNHPLDITDELISREEKIGQIIALEPAEEENIKSILQFYLKKCDPQKRIIDWENYDFSEIVEKLNPNEKGAFGNDKLKRIVETAFEDYKADDSQNFEQHLSEQINSTRRNIRPERIKEFQEDYKELTGIQNEN